MNLYSYSFNIGYPHPYIHIFAHCEEEAIEKFHEQYPNVKYWEKCIPFEKFIKRVGEETIQKKEPILKFGTEDSVHTRWENTIHYLYEARKEQKQWDAWYAHQERIMGGW